MKFNKWTLGLAAVGAVSMASAVRADEAPKLVPLETAVSSTVISGYVDVAAQYNPGNPGATSPNNIPAKAYNQPIGLNPAKVDSFSLNNVTVSLDKPLDESKWASGYHVDLNAGMDAITPLTYGNNSSYGNGGGTVGVRQAYVAMRTPLGNGIDWKMGVFDGVTGYEGNTWYTNPNYTRSYGYAVNPASQEGFIGSYKVMDSLTVQAGIANRIDGVTGNGFGNGTSVGLSSHNYIFTAALTAPDSWGWAKGSTLNAGTDQTFDNGGINNYNVSATIATPVAGLKFGLSYDAVESLIGGGHNSNNGGFINGNIYGVYGTYQATDKLSFNVRGEYIDFPNIANTYGTTDGFGFPNKARGEEVTATIEYDLWANVVSRAEFRWDHVEHGIAYNNGSPYQYSSESYTSPSTESAYMLALNLVYKF